MDARVDPRRRHLIGPVVEQVDAAHQRLEILRLWARMARTLGIAMLVPQHGAPIEGPAAISDFFDWVESLVCGIDLFDDRACQVPTTRIDPRIHRTDMA